MTDTTPAHSVAPTEGNLKRAIQMKMFTTDAQKKRVAFMNEAEAIGQIVGEIITVKTRSLELKDGSVSILMQAIGDFEAMVYETGEVFTSGVANLPKYFLETIAELERLGLAAQAWKGMDVALEIVLVPTGANIPISYEVRPLIARRPDSAVNRMKLALQAANRLRLPAPAPAPALQGEVLAVTHVETVEDQQAEAEEAATDDPNIPPAGEGEVQTTPDEDSRPARKRA